MNRKFKFSIDEFYHIYNRGNDKRDIFLNDSDFERFMRLLFICNSDKPVIFKTIQGRTLDMINRGNSLLNIGVYSLMPNHFHLLLKEKTDGGISMFMKKLSTGYSMYFNKKNNRSGALFESKFKATHAYSSQDLSTT